MILTHTSAYSAKKKNQTKDVIETPSRRKGNQEKNLKTNSRTSSKNSRGLSRSISPKLKIWDPIIGEEEKARRKRMREESYSSRGHKEDPILLIKKREIITKYLPEDDRKHHSPTTIITKSTKSNVLDINHDSAKKDMLESLSKKVVTNYVEEKPDFKLEDGKDYTKETISRIEATEYLPPGFLELDPLLYKDDYDFLNTYHERLFEEDQRRTKELRRKQYLNRKQPKTREVIIYKIDYLKRRATQILEDWFAENNQKMEKKELEKWASILDIDHNTFQKMQDVFISEKTLFGRSNSLKLNKLIYSDNPNNLRETQSEEGDRDIEDNYHEDDEYEEEEQRQQPQSPHKQPEKNRDEDHLGSDEEEQEDNSEQISYKEKDGGIFIANEESEQHSPRQSEEEEEEHYISYHQEYEIREVEDHNSTINASKQDNIEIVSEKQSIKSGPQPADTSKNHHIDLLNQNKAKRRSKNQRRLDSNSRHSRDLSMSMQSDHNNSSQRIIEQEADDNNPQDSHRKAHPNEVQHNEDMETWKKEETERIRQLMEQEYSNKLEAARIKLADEILVRKDIARKVSNDQLWKLFRQFCKDDLPDDEEFQRTMLSMTFFYFLQKKLKEGKDIVQELEVSCNEIIREDLSDQKVRANE